MKILDLQAVDGALTFINALDGARCQVMHVFGAAWRNREAVKWPSTGGSYSLQLSQDEANIAAAMYDARLLGEIDADVQGVRLPDGYVIKF